MDEYIQITRPEAGTPNILFGFPNVRKANPKMEWRNEVKSENSEYRKNYFIIFHVIIVNKNLIKSK